MYFLSRDFIYAYDFAYCTPLIKPIAIFFLCLLFKFIAITTSVSAAILKISLELLRYDLHNIQIFVSIITMIYDVWSAGREMNIQVATSELPVTSPRSGRRLSGANYTQRPQTRFRGSRGTGSIRGNYN